MRNLIFSLPLLIFSLCISSCTFQSAIDAQGNVSTRSQGKIIRSYGDRQFEATKKKRQISRDPKYTVPVERVAKRLQKVIDMPNAQWEFVIFKDPTPNAFALPGGKVGVNTGLFRIADTDALLAAVLGHEISHATAGHATQRMLHATSILVGGALVHQAIENNDSDSALYGLAAYFIAVHLLETLPLSRRQEYESDRIGAIYMAQAGYDPRESLKLWERLSSYHSHHHQTKPDFLRTHPPNQKRIESLKAFMPIAMEHYSRQKKRE